MTDLSNYPGVSTTWPTFTPSAWSAEGVAQAVADYLTAAAVPGLRTVYSAQPRQWAENSANFRTSTDPWGASVYVLPNIEKQSRLYSGTGTPERTIVHSVILVGLFVSTLNDPANSTTLQRRIEDGIKDALRKDPTLGGRVYQAGVNKLEARRDPPAPQDGPSGSEIRFLVEFEVTVYAPPGA